MQLDLSEHPPEAPIVHVWMGVNPVKPQAAQSGLFILAAPEPVKLEITLARIQAITGEGKVGVPELLDTHLPDAFRMSGGRMGRAQRGAGVDQGGGSKLVLRVFRPPLAAEVLLASGQPGFITAGAIRGKVVDLAGPWRTSGDWWTTDAWSRDEWDIALSDGALYRLYCAPKGWFLEGCYD
jgi:protein ImuB